MEILTKTNGNVEIRKAYQGLTIVTNEGRRLNVVLRDFGWEMNIEEPDNEDGSKVIWHTVNSDDDFKSAIKRKSNSNDAVNGMKDDMREIKFRCWDDSNNKMVYDVERGGQFGFYLKNYECMQSTGIKDKNGKDVYECDIVKHYTDSRDYIGVIRWYEWGYIDATNKKLFAEQMNFEKYAEVIGNIYENPELLENISQNPVNG